MSLFLFMPSYNVALFIKNTVRRISPNAWDKIDQLLIIDDGSTDATAMEARALCNENKKIKLKSFAQNQGYGRVVQYGLQAGLLSESQQIVCLHADGQYPPETLLEFSEYMHYQGAQVLQGSRIAGGTALQGGMPLYKYIANRFLTILENRILGLRLTDYHSGYLFYSRDFIASVPIHELGTTFTIDLELIVRARQMGKTIVEKPIPTHYGEQVSHVASIPYGLQCLLVMWKYVKGDYKACS